MQRFLAILIMYIIEFSVKKSNLIYRTITGVIGVDCGVHTPVTLQNPLSLEDPILAAQQASFIPQ